MSMEPATNGQAKIICGSNINDWWKFHNNCKIKWSTMICCKTEDIKRDDVARIELEIAGVIPGPSPTNYKSVRIGETCLFGDDVTGDRCIPLTDQTGINGAAGRGWYITTIHGSPKKATIKPLQLSSLTSVSLAFTYPSGSTFTFKHGTTNRNAAMATSLAALKSATVTTMFFDGSTLFIRLINNEYSSQTGQYDCLYHDPKWDFKRGPDGVYLRHYTYCPQWTLTAVCSTSKTVNGADFCAGAKSIPTSRMLP